MSNKQQSKVKVEELMSGKDWYEKFRIEFRKLAPMSYAKDFYAKKAAQNVAGITETKDE